MITFNSLKDIDIDELFIAFGNAFSDYDFQLDKADLSHMLLRRGYDPNYSFGAFDNGKLVAFTLNGIGQFMGKSTAYDTGTGTTLDYRGRGLAAKIFNFAVPILKDAGFEQYLLEVLRHNVKAFKIYKSLGFTVSRSLNYYAINKNDIKWKNDALNRSVIIESAPISDLRSFDIFHDMHPSWQNSPVALEKVHEKIKVITAIQQGKTVGYAAFEPHSGDIALIGVDKDHRHQGIGLRIIQDVVESIDNDDIKMINVDIECRSMIAFLEYLGIPATGGQYEMTIDL